VPFYFIRRNMSGTKAKPAKLLRVGASMLITLPPEFIRKNKLKPGDRVGLTYNSILVVINPREPRDEKP
jgi:hypothetical protein